jgi:hypothetical protein
LGVLAISAKILFGFIVRESLSLLKKKDEFALSLHGAK